MKIKSTFILRGVVFILGAFMLLLCVVFMPQTVRIAIMIMPELDPWFYPILIGMYIMTLPFFYALYQTLKLLGYIDKGNAFSELSVKALRVIKYCAIVISIMYLGMMPLIYLFAEADDAPGLILFGMLIDVAPIAVATFAAVLERLLREAIDMKTENELTV